jgi:ABC-type multidrug transport system fused ATPase/permease subunit
VKIEKGTFFRLVRDCARAPLLLAAAVAGFAVLGAGRLLLTWLVKLWVEGPIATRDASEIRPLMLEAAFLTGAMFLALGLSRYLLAAANQRLLEDLRGRAAARLFAVELSSVRRRPTGEWISRVFSDAGALTGFVENLVKRLLGDGLVALGALAMMFWIDFRLSIAAAAIVPLFALLLSLFGSRRSRASGRKDARRGGFARAWRSSAGRASGPRPGRRSSWRPCSSPRARGCLRSWRTEAARSSRGAFRRERSSPSASTRCRRSSRCAA